MTASSLHIRPVESEDTWEEARRIRTRVFIEEQACPPEEEWDAYESTSRHLIGYVDGAAVAVARWRTTTVGEEIAAKLERFAVLKEHRGRGYGREMVHFAIQDARRAGFSSFVLHAQAHLEEFYASFGFDRVGDVFEEAGIPHVKMVKREAAHAKSGQDVRYPAR